MSTRPILKRSCKIKSVDPEKVVIEHLEREIVLEGEAARLFARIAPQLHGEASVGRIAEQTRERAPRVAGLLEGLVSAGVVGMCPEDPRHDGFMMSGAEFLELHRKYSSHWLIPVYEHPLWEKMTQGKASRAQVIGFAFEKYHYIEGAHEHMAIAAAHATPEMMPHLARHFIEEYTHGDIYRKGLSSLFPNEVILKSQPLPSTRALVNFLSESAARSSFSYYAGNEVLQMTENTADGSASGSIDAFYEAMRRHYPFSHKLIDSFIAHTRADQKLGHESVFEEMCADIPALTRREVSDAMNVARSMAEHLLLFMDGIDVWYGAHPIVPRMPSGLYSE